MKGAPGGVRNNMLRAKLGPRCYDFQNARVGYKSARATAPSSKSTPEVAYRSNAAAAAPPLAIAKQEQVECGQWGSPFGWEDPQITPYFRTLLCSLCYDESILDNKQCLIPICLQEVPASEKVASIAASTVYEYKHHFVNEPSHVETFPAVNAKAHTSTEIKTLSYNEDAKLSSPSKTSTTSFATAQASPPKTAISSDGDSTTSEPWDDGLSPSHEERKALEAKQLLSAAMAYLIEVYNELRRI